ncbi:MAG: hypothetical protein L3J24_07955 [Xanthomonadales bacterium]|nr:hypothetical protein [Xanthomonadales bacterium]
MTPEGIKPESEVDRSQSVTHSTGRKLDRIVIGFLALAVVLLLINPYQRSDGPDASVTEPEQLTPEQLTSKQVRRYAR